jgi:tetratricopeptide (TPR) repeat protein
MSTENRPVSIALARYRRLPRRTSAIWQGGIVRMPVWIESADGGPPFRPWVAVWVAGPEGLVHMNPTKSGDRPDAAFAADTVVELALKYQDKLAGRPGCIQVLDAAFGQAIVACLGDPDVRIEVVPALDVVDRVLESFIEHDQDGPEIPALLDDPEITVEDVRRFAEAAHRFWLAEPWQHLTDEDLIVIEAPKPDREARCFVVLGNAGMEYGLAFYASPFDYGDMADSPLEFPEDRRYWSVTFGTPDLMPFADHDLWDAHDLPLADTSHYPIVMAYGPDDDVSRPSRRLLRQFETILSALADTTETDIDNGRWTKGARTPGRTVSVRLALPNVLDPEDRDEPFADQEDDPGAHLRSDADVRRFMRARHSPSTEEEDAAIEAAEAAVSQHVSSPKIGRAASVAATAIERAQDIAYRAFDAIGRRRVILARDALAASPDCADAYVVLAEQAAGPARALPWYEQGVAAGERALGAEAFGERTAHFWGTLDTRPYMRARVGLAQTLGELGRVNEAIAHYQDLLRLNPSDNQGVRYLLLLRYVAAHRDADAVELLTRYQDDPTAEWMYTRALVSYRMGMTARATVELAAARGTNPFVPQSLIGPDAESPGYPPIGLSIGGLDEAAEYVEVYGDIWRATPGAMAWISQDERNRTKPRRGKTGGKRQARQRLH